MEEVPRRTKAPLTSLPDCSSSIRPRSVSQIPVKGAAFLSGAAGAAAIRKSNKAHARRFICRPPRRLGRAGESVVAERWLDLPILGFYSVWVSDLDWCNGRT